MIALRQLVLAALLTTSLLVAGSARGETPSASYALIVGVNRSSAAKLEPLRYADDDAARYHDLFRLLGAHTHVLAHMDANTRRLHPQATAEALAPRAAELESVVGKLRVEIRRAKRRGIRTTLYLVYAGHGEVADGEAVILLEDARMNASQLAALVDRVGADSVHLVIDACYSGMLVQGRGPGGKRRPLRGFSEAGPLVKNRRIGLLLSTSSGRESHEWEALQAGVFSHEVRSGLYGAADADRDGRVTYREIAAFVHRANAAIPNERYRPDVYARPPAQSDMLADVRGALRRRVELKMRRSGHWVVENDLGVRLADLNPAANHEMRFARHSGPLFVRLVPESTEDPVTEYAIPPALDVVSLADIEPTAPRVAMRGAAHESFTRLFTLPFNLDTVRSYRPPAPPEAEVAGAPAARGAAGHVNRDVAVALFGLGAASATVGGILLWSGHHIRDGVPADADQRAVAERNERIAERNVAAAVAFAAGGAAVAAGLAMCLWPSDDPSSGLSFQVGPNTASVWLRSRF
jgi:hypothetical protein